MSTIKINPGRKHLFLFPIEIHLSEAQLKVLCELSGDDEHDYLEYYEDLAVDATDECLDANPSNAMGLGADINDILSLGFLLYNHLREANTKVELDDLRFHAFRIKIPKINSVDFEMVDCEIKTSHEPIVYAIKESTGEIVHIDDVTPSYEQKNESDDLPF